MVSSGAKRDLPFCTVRLSFDVERRVVSIYPTVEITLNHSGTCSGAQRRRYLYLSAEPSISQPKFDIQLQEYLVVNCYWLLDQVVLLVLCSSFD